MLVWIKPLPGDKSALGEDEHVAQWTLQWQRLSAQH